MGRVISRTAAADDIYADIETTHENARARGGKWQQLEEEKLGNTIELIGLVRSRTKAAADELTPLLADLDAQDQQADRFIGRTSDEIWNDIGRPAFDPAYDVVFPGGIAYYTTGPDDEQPDRMDLLAELIEMSILPKLDKAKAAAAAKKVREEAKAYREVLDRIALPRQRLRQLERVRTALARVAQMQLANLKRVYKAEGFSEADIHAVIPDHPRSRKEPGAEAPA